MTKPKPKPMWLGFAIWGAVAAGMVILNHYDLISPAATGMGSLLGFWIGYYAMQN